MFGKTRRKIIALVMISMAAVLVLTLAVVYGTSSYELKKENSEKLEQYALLYSLDGLPGSAGPLKNAPEPQGGPGRMPQLPADLQLQTFYSAALSEEGEALAIDKGRSGIRSEEEITALAREILASGRASGRHEMLDYLVAEKTGYTLVAFMDSTLEIGTLNTLLRQILVAGIFSVIVVFVLSLILSRRILRPLEENDKRQRRFVSDAGHELKTPVSIISANTELLEKQAGKSEWLSNIRYENERMGELVKALLDLSRAENKEIKNERIDLSTLVTGEILPFESVAFENDREFVCNIEEGVFVKGDPAGLKQLVSVLADNAVRHSEGRIIEVSLKTDKRNAVLTVSNEGSLSADDMEHLFERFYRPDRARNDDGHYGLGLAIAKAAAEKHKGELSVACTGGKAVFTFSMPAEK